MFQSNEALYNGDGEDWADLKKVARSAVAASKLQAGRNF